SQSRHTCPHLNAKCFQCGKVGHIQTVCRSSKSCKLVNSSNDADISDNMCSLTLSVDTQLHGHLRQPIRFGNGKSHTFIIDTGSVESLIPKSVLDTLYPNIELLPTSITIRGITGRLLPLSGCCVLPLLTENSGMIECKFIVTTNGPSILGLKALQALRVSIWLLSHYQCDDKIRDTLHQCSMATGGMRIPAEHLEIRGHPIFMKRRLVPYGLIEPVQKIFSYLCDSGIVVPIETSQWATPIVTPFTQNG
ncbi:hypothetical protein H7673_10975, partial [Streptococcus dysgalactiae subsp. equisimilis]